jgi:hypothetical protein
MVKILGRNRTKLGYSNAYKIIICGPFVVEIWTLEVAPLEGAHFDQIRTSAILAINGDTNLVYNSIYK